MSKIKYIDPKNEAELSKLIDTSIRTTAKARESVQVAAVAILLHAAKHGDWTKANVLVEGLGDTINGQALVKFFVDFGGLTVNPEGTAFGGWNGVDHIKANLDMAKEKMWWTLRKVNPFAGYNADAELMRFVERFRKTSKQVAGMKPEDQAKVSLIVRDETMKAVLQLVNFEHIVQVMREEEAAAEAPSADSNDRVATDRESAVH